MAKFPHTPNVWWSTSVSITNDLTNQKRVQYFSIIYVTGWIQRLISNPRRHPYSKRCIKRRKSLRSLAPPPFSARRLSLYLPSLRCTTSKRTVLASKSLSSLECGQVASSNGSPSSFAGHTRLVGSNSSSIAATVPVTDFRNKSYGRVWQWERFKYNPRVVV